MSLKSVLVAVAHGSTDPRASDTIGKLMAIVGERAAGLDVRVAYLGHALPSLSQVMTAIDPGRPVAVVPLLLTAAYHSKAEIPRILARFPRRQLRYGAPLGPHPLLLPVLERRLAQADPAAVADPARTGVVLAAAGSSDPGANASIARLAAQWQAGAGWFAVRPAYASVASPDPGAAVTGLLRDGARRVAVATYLLAPGYFADRIRDTSLAAGASAVSATLGASAEVAEVLLDRFREARTGHRAPAAAMPEARCSVDDPRATDVRALVERHLEFARSHKPPGDVHALDVAGLLDPAVTFFSCRERGELGSAGDAEFREDRLHMVAERVPGDEERLGDLSGGQPGP